MADDTVLRTMLFDFYGELLTEKQREYFDLYYNEDLSLAEIAETGGISRQGVWDVIRRADQTLHETERKTGILRRFTQRREVLAQLSHELSNLLDSPDEAASQTAARCIEKIQALAE